MTPQVETVTVKTRIHMKAFVDLPWKIYSAFPYWVPPLKKEAYRLLDTSWHPFWRNSELLLVLAQRGSETVGRIAGIIDHNYNMFHKENGGIWGFFECVDDAEVAQALFLAVEEWARLKGLDFLRGPFNPSTNYEAGLLVKGFDHRPSLMMSYNPPYYPELVESCGFTKEKDLLSFVADGNHQPPAWMQDLSRRIRVEHRAWTRPVCRKKFETEAILIKKIYHDAWSRNWGFVPATEDEFRLIAKNVARVLDEDLAFFVCCGEEPVGVALILPDINPLLKHLNGGTGPLSLLKAFLYKKTIRGARGFMFGIREDFQEMGLPIVALDHIMRTVNKSRKYDYFEFGWNLEDNDGINQWLLGGGMRVHNRYRIYSRPF